MRTPCDHEWKESYYGHDCVKCGTFVPFGGGPWDDADCDYPSDDQDEWVLCLHCEHGMDWVDCDQCGGEGMGDHDCGEDCCACLDPEPNTPCDQCAGAGGWYWCSNSRCAGKK